MAWYSAAAQGDEGAKVAVERQDIVLVDCLTIRPAIASAAPVARCIVVSELRCAGRCWVELSYITASLESDVVGCMVMVFMVCEQVCGRFTGSPRSPPPVEVMLRVDGLLVEAQGGVVPAAKVGQPLR
jgi:hypothetical protein